MGEVATRVESNRENYYFIDSEKSVEEYLRSMCRRFAISRVIERRLSTHNLKRKQPVNDACDVDPRRVTIPRPSLDLWR